MAIDKPRATVHLKAFDFSTLFIEELGWDRPASRQTETVEVGGQQFTLRPVADKRGVRIFQCPEIPDRATRQRIEREITKLVYEHLIIFTDSGQTKQIWQWVAREKGKPAAFREHLWLASTAPDALLQKLDHISFTLSEEEGLTLTGTTLRLRDAFDREQITKRFYEDFKKQHDRFLKFIEGLASVSDRQWYASLMLNRLMFVYFIQKKRFLNDDIDYLKNKLAEVRERKGTDQFHTFYRAFLLKLFHGGLAKAADARDPETVTLLGRIPYLNGGLFEPHALEAEGHTIQIADAAFEGVFAFFDQYEWTLDTRPIEEADGKEINPDVLGHIFEKYINQKQMGAYYTKEDITDYITKNTVVPWLFQNAIGHDKVAFEPGGFVWRLLSENPDNYIYPSVRHGMDSPLPDEIAAGIADVSQRGDWNKTAPREFGLPTEVWREVIARRDCYEATRSKAASGEITSIEDFITYNLDIRQFARDVIQYAESPDVVRAFWKGISSIKILDPACGSGAFLFAALNIMYDLYDACLERMEQFVASAPHSGSGRRQLYSDFHAVLDQIAQHPNRDYFIYKSIIIANLYGVDIMDEAVEICKLRLFLKLAAQLENPNQIEPLPDIDFNIRSGNSVIGFRSIEDAQEKAQRVGLPFDDLLSDIQRTSDDIDNALKLFRNQQVSPGGHISHGVKQTIRDRLTANEDRLNDFLVRLYAPSSEVSTDAGKALWLQKQKPFHWLIDFHDIVSQGGFSAIVGNPPYVEIDRLNSRKALLAEFETCLEKWSRDEDLYTLFVERSLSLIDPKKGSIGLILPLSVAFSTKRPFTALRTKIASCDGSWRWSHFDRIPSSLFGNDVRTRCSIGIYHTQRSDHASALWTTSLKRWSVEERDSLFDLLKYAKFEGDIKERIPKLADSLQARGLTYFESLRRPLALQLGRAVSANALIDLAPSFPEKSVFVAGTAYNWFPAWRSIPTTSDQHGRPSVPARAVGFSYENEDQANIVFALLCSSLGYWWWAVASDGFNLKKWLIESFPLAPSAFSTEYQKKLAQLGADLKCELEKNYVYKDNQGRKGNFFLPACEKITRQIDEVIDEALDGIDKDFIQSVQSFNASFSRVASDADEAG
ncbi:DNA methyltransferase [Sphingomicrobium sp. XHP0235]|uniref:Eco57I restriction-modification methylase domain-containing protein n=1 Tax=Sphingomicrobium aquimarinum TaxID=3133971 RepID=UPI0031FE96A5